jgi:RNA polymerase sigma factor (sigma-70 family)
MSARTRGIRKFSHRRVTAAELSALSGLSDESHREPALEEAGPEAGFSATFGTYAPAVLRFAWRRLESQDAAWDVVSDTFTAAWRHWGRRPEADQLLPWLYAIAANAVRSRQRASGRQGRLVTRLSAGELHQVPDLADGVVSRHAVADAFSRLSEADQEVLRLVAWEGLTDARSIGLVLGLSPGTARGRIHRARRRLRGLLAQADEPPGEPAQPTAPSASWNQISEI